MIKTFYISAVIIMLILKQLDVCYTAGFVIGMGILMCVYLLIMDARGEI